MPVGKMNKRVASSVSTHVSRLEKELTSKIVKSGLNAEAGRDVTTDLTNWQKQALGRQVRMAVHVGRRRRHPLWTLNQYTTFMQNEKNPKNTWEKYIADSNQMSELPETYKAINHEGFSTQEGLVKTAFENFKKDRVRFGEGIPVGF